MTIKGQARHAFPAYRVFIFGIDVTEDTFSVQVEWTKGRAPNKCRIELSNELDKYIFTTDDLTLVANIPDEAKFLNATSLALGGTADFEFEATTPTLEDSIDEIKRRKLEQINTEPKRTILNAKLFVTQASVKAREIDGQQSNLPILNGDALRYPFQAEDSIFHANDPIRIFFRDPFNPKRWYHMFAGLVSNFDDAVDENNQRILTIGGEGPLKRFRYARMTLGPGIADLDQVPRTRLDAIIRTAWASGFEGLTLPELLFIMVFGNDPSGEFTTFSIDRSGPSGRTISAGRFGGVGNYNFGRSALVEFGGKSPGVAEPLDLSIAVPVVKVNDLSEWQALIDHEVKETDLFEMVAEDLTPPASEINNLPKNEDDTIRVEDIINFIGTRPDIYDVEGGRLLILAPESLHPTINREILLKDLNKNFAPLTTEFRSRLGIMYDVIDRLEFALYESPKGDIIIEFPLYDFDPDDWDPNIFLKNAANGATLTVVPHQTILNGILNPIENVKRGPFLSNYVINKRDTYNFSKQTTDEKIRTQVIAYWNLIQNYNAPGTSKRIGNLVDVTLDHLVPLYGLRQEQVNAKSFIDSEQGAQLYAQIVTNQLNADARNLGINAVPKFESWLNRPIFFQERNCIATTASITHSIKWGMGGSADTRLNLQYLRGWDGNIDLRGNPVFATIGGVPSRPFNYAVLFGIKEAAKGTVEQLLPPPPPPAPDAE